jgi:hypothetical protein
VDPKLKGEYPPKGVAKVSPLSLSHTCTNSPLVFFSSSLQCSCAVCGKCSWQLWQHCVCSTRLSSGQIWALLSRLSNHFWSLLPQLQRLEQINWVFLVLDFLPLHSSVSFVCGFHQILYILFKFFYIWDWMFRTGFMILPTSVCCWYCTGCYNLWSHKLNTGWAALLVHVSGKWAFLVCIVFSCLVLWLSSGLTHSGIICVQFWHFLVGPFKAVFVCLLFHFKS